MDNKTPILVLCTHEGIMDTILRLINNNSEWHATGALTVTSAKELFNINTYNIILLGNGLSTQEEQEMTDMAQTANTKVIQHFGGGSGLLFGEIYEALAGKG